MKFHWLLPSTLSIVLLSSPAEAAKLKSWQFNAKQNRLEFKTDGKVQPKAQLIFNPTRLVIDLPGTNLDRSTIKQQASGLFRSVRVGQFDEQTTRLVIELNPGYGLDPQQVKFRGVSPRHWMVQLPLPYKLDSDSTTAALPPRPLTAPESRASSPKALFSLVRPSTNSTANPKPPLLNRTTQANLAPNAAQVTNNVQIERVLPTGDGFYVRVNGKGRPELDVERSGDRTKIYVELKGATLPSRLTPLNLRNNQYGVSSVQLSQVQNSPPVVRLTMQVDKNSPDWQATVSPIGGVVLLPVRGVAASQVYQQRAEKEVETDTVSENQSPDVATIRSIQLDDNSQLLIRGDQILTYASGWDRASGSYSITIPNARLDSSFQGPNLNANSPILRVRLRETGSRTVVILVQPAAGVRLEDIKQPRPEVLSVQLQRSSVVLVPPSSSNSSNPIPIPSPAPASEKPAQRPSTRQERAVVIVDPGHGGKDPGAVGIGGLQEKHVILPVAQKVAELLEKQGLQPILTRDSDYFVGLGPRVAKAEGLNADLFVSIHANSMGMSRPDVNGLETYYFESGRGLAQAIHSNVLRSVKVRDRGVRRARFFVLRKSSMPSVLVEIGYVTGREDAPRLRTEEHQNQLAEAIVRGIMQYINSR